MSWPGKILPRIFLLFCLTMGMALSGCDETGELLAGETSIIPAAPIPKPTLWSGDMSRAESLEYFTAHNTEQWEKLWLLVGQPAPRPDLPDGYMAVGIFLGQRPTPGYAVKIVSLDDIWSIGIQDVYMIRFREIMPAKGAILPAHLTSPWLVKLVPAQKFDPQFSKEH